MTLDEHAYSLGKLLANFQSLEFILRAFLWNLPLAPSCGVPCGTDIYSLPVGTELDECAFTNYDSLGKLIEKYNLGAGDRRLPQIDPTLVDIRDALAHGRVSTDSLDQPPRLLKFSCPRNGRVRITFNEQLTQSWFKHQIHRVCEAIQSVRERVGP